MKGVLEVITGCMFSGKSEELLRRTRRAIIAKQKVALFKPSNDDRYGLDKVRAHSGAEKDAICINRNKPNDIEEMALSDFGDDVQVVAIEEVQFFTKEIVNVIDRLADSGKRVIVSGLDMDFRGEPFGYMPELMARADKLSKLSAICEKCSGEATRSQRLINGKPASRNSPLVLVGGQDFYEARCRSCHEIADDETENVEAASE